MHPTATQWQGPPLLRLLLPLLALCLLRSSAAKESLVRPDKKFDKLVSDANKALEAKNLTRAIKRLRQALAIRPKDLDVWRILGKSLYESGRFEEAEKTFTKALGLDPTHRTTRKVLADASAAAGNLADSLWHFGQVAVSSQIVLPPLSEALVPAWIAKREKQASKALPPPPEAAGVVDAPRVFFADLPTLPRAALRSLRDFLSGKIVGKAYNFEFRSSSVPLTEERAKPSSLLRQAIQQLQSLLPSFARKAARCAEWWVHRRPPREVPAGVHRVGLEGHPFHWDNDGKEALGEKPLYTSLLFMTDGALGAPSPTLVLNTSVIDGGFNVGDAAWIMHAQEGRVAYFQGGMLHGVLPSAGFVDFNDDPGAPARLSLNVAWWPHACRVDEKVDSVAGVPGADASWAAVLAEAAPVERRVPRPTYDVFCGEDRCGRGEHSEL